MKNGAVYFDMRVTYLIGIVFSVYGLFVLFQLLWGKHTAKNNIYTVTLGPRIMRCETAPIAAVSAVMYELGDW